MKKSDMKELVYRVTFRCNKSCYFCYNNNFQEKVNYRSQEKLDISALLTFIKQKRIKRVTITGGEPSVREDLPEIISQISKLTTVKIFTNGNLLFKYTAQEILDMGISKIVCTIYDDDIYGKNLDFTKMVECIKGLRNEGVVVDGNMFLDSDYFNKREKMLEIGLNKVFDNVRWQPLLIPKGKTNYEKTIFGMDTSLRNQIFESVEKDDLGGIREFYQIFNKWINSGTQPHTCLYPHCVYTVDPDLKLFACPHKNAESFTLDNYDQEISGRTFDDCLSIKCLHVYKYK